MAGLMALPSLLPFLAFVVVPVGYVAYLSFTSYDGITQPHWTGLANYRLMIHDGAWWASVVTTLIFTVGVIAIGIPLSLLLALLLNRPLPGLGVLRTIYFLPQVLSIAVMGVVFHFLLRPTDGVVNSVLQWLHLLGHGHDVDWLGSRGTAMSSLIAVGIWSTYGINAVFFLVGLQTVPRDVLQSAELDGASAWQRFRLVTLPLMAPVTRVVTMLSIVFALRAFDLVKTLTDGGPAGQTNVMFTYLFGYYFNLDQGTQYGYGSALAMAASLIIAVVTVIYLYLSRRGRGGEGVSR